MSLVARAPAGMPVTWPPLYALGMTARQSQRLCRSLSAAQRRGLRLPVRSPRRAGAGHTAPSAAPPGGEVTACVDADLYDLRPTDVWRDDQHRTQVRRALRRGGQDLACHRGVADACEVRRATRPADSTVPVCSSAPTTRRARVDRTHRAAQHGPAASLTSLGSAGWAPRPVGHSVQTRRTERADRSGRASTTQGRSTSPGQRRG